MASLLNIGISSLTSTQTALQTTGNNISNANVEGYSRQSAEFAARPGQFVGVGYIGAGSKIDAITRNVDNFLQNQLYRDTAAFNNLDTVVSNIEQLDSLFADEFSGLLPGMESFFGAVAVGSEDPTSMPARQLILSEAEGLVERFHTLNDRLEQQSISINDQMESLTLEVTELAVSIAKLNEEIETKLAISQGQQPNGLMDQRDELLRKLSEIVDVRIDREGLGSMNIFIGNGQQLVVGNIVNSLGVQQNAQGHNEVVFIGQTGVGQEVSRFITGGKLGGILQFRNETLDPAFNALGRIAIALSEGMNYQNRQGLDLESNFGGDIFGEINSAQRMGARAVAGVGNSGTTANISIDNLNQLSIHDYTMQVVTTVAGQPDTVRITRSDGGDMVDAAGNTVASGAVISVPVAIDGFSVGFDLSETYAADDLFRVQPTRNGASDISLQIQRPQELAFASAVVTDSALSNRGTGSISPGIVLDSSQPEFINSPPAMDPPLLIRFTSATTFDVLDNSVPAAPVAISVGNAFTPNQANTLTFNGGAGALRIEVQPVTSLAGDAYQLQINGAPQNGDQFTIDINVGGISDNRNAVAMSTLRINGNMENGKLSFEDAYGSMVEDIGSQTARLRIGREAANSLLVQTRASRDAVSGVNIDEEAANLIRFEQAYSASAQVINVARQIFDTLLRSFG